MLRTKPGATTGVTQSRNIENSLSFSLKNMNKSTLCVYLSIFLTKAAVGERIA